MSDLKWLRDYKLWTQTNALAVREAVKGVGGWAIVFPDHVPRWASRVRNYFNETPRQLMRLDETRSKAHSKAAKKASID